MFVTMLNVSTSYFTLKFASGHSKSLGSVMRV